MQDDSSPQPALGRFRVVTLDFFRNEGTFRTRCLKAAQVAVIRARHDTCYADIDQRDDPTWISSFSRVPVKP